MKYNVFLCPELRIKFTDIEADSQLDALKKAEDLLCEKNGITSDIRFALGRLGRPEVEYVELSEDCYNSLVDEVGDEEYENSTWYNCEDKPEWTERFLNAKAEANAPEMLELLKDMVRAYDGTGPQKDAGECLRAYERAKSLIMKIEENP